jgi:hypothetical protein
MKRKYLSALLMGVLTLSSVSTFTSCKDYDDDINSLQEQVNKAALSSDVEALKTQVNNAASSAQNAATKAEEALTKAGANETEIAKVKELATKAGTDVANALTNAANAASDAAKAADAAKVAQDSANAALTKIAGLDKELKNLALNAQSHVTATQLKNSLDSLSEVINKATSDSIANLTKIVNGYKGGINALYTAVTEVSLIGSWNDEVNGSSLFTDESHLIFKTGTIPANYTFGANEKDDENGEHSADPKKSYVEGASVNFPSEFLVRINPVNAKITPDMIKLIDSKGNDLDKLVKVVDVEKFDKLLTSRASETGLWSVKVQLQDGVKPENVEQKVQNGDHILYAVAVNNTASQAETVADAASRYVVSTYDLTVNGTTPYVGANNLGNVKVKAESKEWKTVSSIKSSSTSTNKPIYAANGENVLVSFENLSNVDRFYVVRDDKHAGESDASELNAWKSYEYQGLNQVVAVEHGTGVGTLNIKINGQVGDEVQFRIFAVNYNGTLVEQNGRPFRVYVGAQSTTTSVAGNLVATGKETMETGWLPISGNLKKDGTLPPTVWVTVNNVKIEANVEYAKDNEGNPAPAGDNSKIKFAKFSVNAADLIKWADGATATGTIKDNANLTVNTISVSLTKVMPTAESTKALMKYSWKDNQLSNGVYTAYLYPAADAWTTENVATGYKNMTKAINGLKENFVISIANAALKTENDGKKYYKDALNVTADPWKVVVSNAKDAAGVALIDNETKHETTIGYNYGQISSLTPDKDYIVNVETVQTVFACPLTDKAQTYSWTKHEFKNAQGKVTSTADVNVLTYGNANTLCIGKDAQNNLIYANLFDYINGHNDFDNTVFGGKLSILAKEKYVDVDAKLISNGSKQEDYFKAHVDRANGTIWFEAQSGATNPVKDVASTLIITVKDAFGHTSVYPMDFTVKRAE